MSKYVLLTLLLWIPNAHASVVGQPVEYEADGVKLQGYLAYEFNQQGKRPGILVIHEWWGHNQYVRKRADMLAELGYTALAVDMYGGGKQAAHPMEAGQMAAEVTGNLKLAEARFEAALRILREHRTTVGSERIGVVGYCFGGGIALQMARLGYDLTSVVSFHGSLSTAHPAAPGAVKAKILVCHGEEDALVSKEELKKFNQEMEDAGADFTVKTYPGAKHSFTNPRADELARTFDLPIAYDYRADEQSWQDMKAFLEASFSEAVSRGDEKEARGAIKGTVRFIDGLEGGFFGIIGEDSKRYDPVNLDPKYQSDGLSIQFTADKQKGLASFRMWGELVKIADVKTLETSLESAEPLAVEKKTSEIKQGTPYALVEEPSGNEEIFADEEVVSEESI